MSVSDGGAILTWSAGDDLKDEEEEDTRPVRLPSAHYEVYYKSVGDNSTSASVFESDKVILCKIYFHFISPRVISPLLQKLISGIMVLMFAE